MLRPPVTGDPAPGLDAVPPLIPGTSKALLTFSGFSDPRRKRGGKAHTTKRPESVGDTDVLTPEAALLPEQCSAHQPGDPEAPRCRRRCHSETRRPAPGSVPAT